MVYKPKTICKQYTMYNLKNQEVFRLFRNNLSILKLEDVMHISINIGG